MWLHWRKLIVLGVLFLITACSSMQVIPDFNQKLLNRHGVIIAGVSTSKGQLSLKKHVEYAQLLELALSEQYPDLKVVTAKRAYKAMGSSMYQQMLDSYRFHDAGGVAFMNILSQQFPEARYAIFARIEGDEVQRKQKNTENNANAQELLTLRLMAVSARIYDLQERQSMVWAGAVKQADVKRKTIYERGNSQFDESFYPAVPKDSKILAVAFKKLSAGLPNR